MTRALNSLPGRGRRRCETTAGERDALPWESQRPGRPDGWRKDGLRSRVGRLTWDRIRTNGLAARRPVSLVLEEMPCWD